MLDFLFTIKGLKKIRTEIRKDKFNSEQSDKRLTITGLEYIKKYCLTNIISSDMNLLIIDKKKHEIDDIKNTYISKD